LQIVICDFIRDLKTGMEGLKSVVKRRWPG
jgi:hypothetical protein